MQTDNGYDQFYLYLNKPNPAGVVLVIAAFGVKYQQPEQA
jgi:hypothetical protein